MATFTETVQFTSNTQIDFVDVTDAVRDVVAKSGITNGVVTIFAAHTTMGVVINHNEPMLLQDMAHVLQRLVPIDAQYAHDVFELRSGRVSDGRSNGHSHCKAMLMGSSESVPLADGALLLGARQSIMAVDVDGPRTRDVTVHIVGV